MTARSGAKSSGEYFCCLFLLISARLTDFREPIAAGDWTFLGGSAFDTGFRQDLNDIAEYFKPKRNDSGLRYLVIKVLMRFEVRFLFSAS